VELHGTARTGLYQQLMLANVFPDHSLVLEDRGFAANHNFEPLNKLFLDPERAGIAEVNAARSNPEVLHTLEPVDSHRILSAPELRNNLRLIQSAYAEFDLGTSEFAPVALLTPQFLAFCKNDYLIELPTDRFEQLVQDAGVKPLTRRLLVHRGDDYVANTNVFAPFIDIGASRISTVALLNRYIYHWLGVCLNHMRRFQIRAGFIFENSVKSALDEQSFTVTGVKRINRKEFDVVAVLDRVIYNIQCKNNLVDLTRLESDPARFARYNRQLDRYYARALVKEEGREKLLKDELHLDEVRHIVVSRFPVATDNPRIIPFSRISRFRATFS
jgi:hypothetical protein